ncbi:VOC family protein [Paracraurococcus lichenis]|uniref:VOC family protein n=1 Tax=Paracraurococcus lichenis TaxID=3064888 RepID=A0ABT9E4B5_9PROT|nr:VOC family protein [Paracraurococcus sp. LOR1-02]MDO9710937.1 VOC family protein [Paracraurococcus sp. LOR1-02]
MTRPECPWTRTAESLGNSVELQHVNLRVPDQLKATAFYISALGLTRDPYLVTGIDNMWANAGVSQFHLPTGPAQRLRGTVGLVLPDREQLLHRLQTARRWLDGTMYAFEEREDHVAVTCPWGNRIRCHGPDADRFGRIVLGMPYVEFDVPPDTLDGIIRFYREIVAAPAAIENGVARVLVAPGQVLTFRETDAPQPAYDGHHIQLAFVDFGGVHARLSERGLISQEDSQHQYRFIKVVDPDNGRLLFEVEHECRSVTHPLFMRKLVNRNPAVTNTIYATGQEAMAWTMPPA